MKCDVGYLPEEENTRTELSVEGDPESKINLTKGSLLFVIP